MDEAPLVGRGPVGFRPDDLQALHLQLLRRQILGDHIDGWSADELDRPDDGVAHPDRRSVDAGSDLHERLRRLAAGLIAYAERLQGTIKLRPDSKIVVTRTWGDPSARLNGLFQLTKGLSAIARKAR